MSEAAVTHAGTQEDPAKRAQILEGAKRVFLAEGYEGASMSLIAREAGVSKGTLYVYFANKEALFAAFIEDQCRRTTADVFEVLNGGDPAHEVLGEFGRRFLNFKLSPEPHAIERLVIGESSKFPELGRAFYNAGPKTGVGRLTDFLRRRIAAGELDIDDPALGADQFLGLCMADLMLKRRMSVIETATPQRIGYIVDRAVDVFMKAYKA
ncbi:MAG: TetR/AcrR family transcriptional regulator [Parvibaculum sp.]|uniref:TetR/AcrR family transcriptional regulator n=1 Tax=Parvibaculum sp. TaxID=2024848 RepID=UPI0025E977F0|nr:TetR/AcrR family transcriptional regulator [Parvibaculum sp.]MCE9648614.1 TetR/AcrR family transcriptional regulator [Parvibaculum sp.]